MRLKPAFKSRGKCFTCGIDTDISVGKGTIKKYCGENCRWAVQHLKEFKKSCEYVKIPFSWKTIMRLLKKD